jgi:hypothetical protein
MAKLDFDYKVDSDTDAQATGGGGILPHMYARVQVESATPTPTKDSRGTQVELTFEVVEPSDFAGRKFWAYWTVAHADEYQNGPYKYGKPRFDKLVRATGNDADEFARDPDTDHLLFKTFVVEIGIEIGSPNPTGGFYKDKNNVQNFFFEDAGARVPVPELGVIGDGTQGKKRNPAPAAAPANDNRPAPAPVRQAAAPAAGGSKPWGKK